MSTQSADHVTQRLAAWKAGKPLPWGTTLHFPVASPEDILVVAFVRMGGESSPWGIVAGHPGEKPQTFTVPEARNRELVAAMCEQFAPLLLEHFRHPAFADDDFETVKLLPPHPPT